MIPEQTLLNFPLFGDNATKVEPDNNKKSNGWQQGDVVPAEWMNWEWYHASKGVADLNKGVNSMEKEMNSVLSAAGISPSESTNNQLLTSIMKVIHPVGSIYWTSKAPNDGGDPNSLFGGVWVQIKDKFILAAGDTYSNGATGGAATVTLTDQEMPGHTHSCTPSGTISGGAYSFTGTAQSSYAGDFLIVNKNNAGNLGFVMQGAKSYAGGALIDTAQLTLDIVPSGSISITTNPTFSGNTENVSASGGNQPHNNMPPYIVKYCWERTA